MNLNARSFACLALGASLACVMAASAQADQITFTWNPSGVGLATPSVGLIGPADNFTAVDNATVTLGSGFSEIGSLAVNEFLLGSAVAPSSGLQSDYSLLFGFNGAGGSISVPGSGLSSTAPFTALNYTLFGIPLNGGSPPTVTPTTDVSSITGAVPLAYGSLVSGTATLTNVPGGPGVQGGYSAKADLNLTLSACTAAGQGNTGFGNALCTGDESAFFASPNPMDISLLIGDFSATTSVTSLSGDTLTINGGGGNLTLNTSSVPEPMSLLVLGTSLLTLGLIRRQRRV